MEEMGLRCRSIKISYYLRDHCSAQNEVAIHFHDEQLCEKPIGQHTSCTL